LRILFTLTQAFNPNDGGIQNTTFKLGKYFSINGNEVAYYSLSKDGHVEAKYGQLFTAPETENINNILNISDLEKVLKQFKPDIVINQMPYEKKLNKRRWFILGKLIL